MSTESKRRGRPVSETSKRQERLKLQEVKRANGTFKRGRPKGSVKPKVENVEATA